MLMRGNYGLDVSSSVQQGRQRPLEPARGHPVGTIPTTAGATLPSKPASCRGKRTLQGQLWA